VSTCKIVSKNDHHISRRTLLFLSPYEGKVIVQSDKSGDLCTHTKGLCFKTTFRVDSKSCSCVDCLDIKGDHCELIESRKNERRSCACDRGSLRSRHMASRHIMEHVVVLVV
jgi:hypothetical protein